MGHESPDSTRVTLLHRLAAEPQSEANWAEFVALYGPVIGHWCQRWGLQECDAQDVTQTVLVRLTAKLPGFAYDHTKSFRGWLKTLTHHAWHDFITDSSRRTRGSGDSAVLAQLHSAEARGDLEARVEAAFDRELLDIAVERVKARVAVPTWAAFARTAFDGADPAAVAGELGVRVSQVYLSKHRVQKLLTELVAELESEL